MLAAVVYDYISAILSSVYAILEHIHSKKLIGREASNLPETFFSNEYIFA